MCCRYLNAHNPVAAKNLMAVLHQKEKRGEVPMCPGTCAKQLVLDAVICSKLASQATASMAEVGEQCVKGLLASKLAVILDPSCWFEVSPSYAATQTGFDS